MTNGSWAKRAAAKATWRTYWCWVLWPMLAAVACSRAARVSSAPLTRPGHVTAIVGATVIDGTGAPPLSEATVLLASGRIAAVGPQHRIRVPTNAELIDGRGLFVLPGFIDANVHLTEKIIKTAWLGERAGGTGRLPPDRLIDSLIAVRMAHALHYGVTTVRDSYGLLRPLQRARDRVRVGDLPGPRLLVAGNIVGWGPPGSSTFGMGIVFDSRPELEAELTQGTGEDLSGLGADSLRVRINRYLDKGPDFIKYGATTHMDSILLFGSQAQRVIVEETKKRGLIAETHASSLEGLRMATLAGVDLIQHPESYFPSNLPLPDELIRLFIEHRVICAIQPARQQEQVKDQNVRRLIQAGCTIAVTTDEMPGKETLIAIEVLVEQMGMSPMAALVAATRNGALACKQLDQLGTVEAGKLADLVVLRADPLQDIKNIEQIVMVFAGGRRIARAGAEKDTTRTP